MATAFHPYSNATVIFQIPTATLVTDPTTGNQRPVIDPVPVRAFLKFRKTAGEPQQLGTPEVTTVFEGRATEAIPATVIETTPVQVQLDEDTTIWSGTVQTLRAPYGAGGIGATIAEIAGEAIVITAWRQP